MNNIVNLFLSSKNNIPINTRLAVEIGFNEAVVLRQVYYWVEINEANNRNFHDGKYWCYNTMKMWQQENFPFWSTKTIERAFKKLTDIGVIITGNYNKDGRDKTKWYAIDFDVFERIIKGILNSCDKKSICNKTNCLNANRQNDDSQSDKMTEALPENTTREYNRDYISENMHNSFSNEKDNSKPDGLDLQNSQVGELGTDAKEPKESDSPKSNIIMTLGRKERPKKEDVLKDMPTRAKEIVEQIPGCEDLADKTYDCVDYFMCGYKAKMGHEHVNLTNVKLREAVETMLSTLTVPVEGANGDFFENDYNPLIADNVPQDECEEVIDQYFDTAFREKTDYSILHFTQTNILTKIMNKCYLNGHAWHESHEPY